VPWLASNAPYHWPNLYVDFTDPGDWDRSSLRFVDELFGALEEQGGHPSLTSVRQLRLTDEGIVKVPGLVEDNGRTVPVFLFPKAGPDASAEWAGLLEIYGALGEPPPVYYAIEPMRPAPPRKTLLKFHPEVFAKPEAPMPTGEYAMWWTTPEDPDFATSKTVASIDRAFRALEGYESYVLAAILKAVGAAEGDARRVPLPEDGLSLKIQGPEFAPVVVTAMQEKGLRFHLHTKSTSTKYRERFWKLFAEYAEERRSRAQERGFAMDEPSPNYGRPQGWWEAAKRAAVRHAGEGAVMSFGLYVVGGDSEETLGP